jgi:filamentous hemagglutinin
MPRYAKLSARCGPISAVAGSHPITEVAVVSTNNASGPATVVRTVGVNANVSSNSLFSINRNPGATYLVETDPRFTNYRSWLSSDYMLQQLNIDPATLHKRLGDGFYEQKLVREQVAQLTGRRFLDGYANDEAEYRALINNGVTVAREWNLRPGVALTAEQMAALTSDIVWLVEKEVVLPNGQVAKALVPQLYVRVKPGDVDGSGALIAGDTVNLNLSGDLTNAGTIAGRSVVSLTAENVKNLGGRMSGADTVVRARTDLDNLGGVIDGANSLTAMAGRDLNVVSTMRTQTGSQSSRTHVVRVAGLYVSNPGGTLVATAGRDANLIAAEVRNAGQGGSTTIAAGNNLNLGTVTESSEQSIVWNEKNYRKDASRQDVGTRVIANGDIRLSAGNDLNAKAASVASDEGAVLATAGRNVHLAGGESGRSFDEAHQTTGRSSAFSKTTVTTRDTLSETKSVATTFSGDVVAVTAGNDMTLQGAHLAGTKGVLLDAGGDIFIAEGRETRNETHLHDEKKSGFAGSIGGIPVPLGAQNRITGSKESDTAAASTISSNQGSVRIAAGGIAILQGTEIDASDKIAIKAAAVDIRAATRLQQENEERYKKGTNISVTGWHEPSKGINAKETSTGVQSGTELARTTLTAQNIDINAANGDLHMAGTTVNAASLNLDAAGTLQLGAQSTQQTTSQTTQGRDVWWQKVKSEGKADETTHYNELNVAALTTRGNNVQVQIAAPASISQLAQQPGMHWMAQLQADPSLSGKVDWKRVEEAHEKWQYKKQGLTPEGAAIVTLVVAYFTAGAAAGAGNALAAGVGATGTTATVVAGAAAAAVTTLATQASIAMINNQGDIGKALDDLGSSQSVKSLLSAIVTGGALAYINPMLNLPGTPKGNLTFPQQLGKTWSRTSAARSSSPPSKAAAARNGSRAPSSVRSSIRRPPQAPMRSVERRSIALRTSSCMRRSAVPQEQHVRTPAAAAAPVRSAP